MKKFLRLLLMTVSVGVVSNACVAATLEVPNRTPEEIEKLVSPIALYPDSLVAIILPAATESADVVLAARFLSFDGKESDIDKQFWHESVKSLAHYPDLIKWMDENLEWTQQMGEVFAAQPADVMAAIQRLRAHARANGLLADTPEQRVVVEQEEVYIVPSNPRYIYIPRYDPEILWMRRSHHGPFISFSLGFGVGNWLLYDCDWPGRTIWVHRRHPGWVYTPFWRPPPPAVRVNVVTAWRPPTHFHHRTHLHGHRPPAVVVVPPPCGLQHRFHPSDRRDDRRDRGPGRPTPPGHVGPGRPSGPHVSPVSPVTPMTHVGVAPNHPRSNLPQSVGSNSRPHNNSHRVSPPVPPSHEPQQRVHPGSSRPGPGPATATLHRSAPRAPSEPAVSAPPPTPSSPPRPMGPPPARTAPRSSGSPRPAAPPPAPATSAPASNEDRRNSGNSNNSGNGNDGGGRHQRRGH